MQVTHPVIPVGRASILLLLLICAACQGPRPVSDNRYERSPDAAESATPTLSKPLQQLHNQALAAINEDQYALAADYLQRAIKIEPRNGWSWHYLADIHWRQGQRERCRSMLDRAEAYALGDAQLTRANSELRSQCQ